MNTQETTRRTRRLTSEGRAPRRQGAIIILTAILMVAFMAMLAFSVDIGYIVTVQSELDRAVDSGALAGAGTMVDGSTIAETAARDFVTLNQVGGGYLSTADVTTETGHWIVPNGGGDGYFSPTNVLPSAIRVTGRANDQPLFFAKVLGHDQFDLEAEAIAVYQPRDIVLVLDYSASMNDDSEFGHIGHGVLTREDIEANLLQIHGELGSPTYGNMDWAPRWTLVNGVQPASDPNKAHIDVEYRFRSAYVTSDETIYSVKLTFSSGNQTILGSSNEGLFQGTGGNAGKSITKVEVTSGYNSSDHISTNRYKETFDFGSSVINNVIKTSFGLNAIAYPYPSGSWDTYINYVKSSGNTNDSDGGYRYKFGAMNLVHYWLEQKPMFNQTPTLWQTSEQPITALKNGVTVFLDFMNEAETEDRISLCVYTSANDTALIEHSLTDEYELVEQTSRQRQAGHYDTMTNIGAGIQFARQELEDNARPGAFKMIVLMTDGIANLPTNTTTARTFALSQTDAVAADGYPIVTIGLGTGADTALLQDIAGRTDGACFIVPGGQSISDMEDQLKAVFRSIAKDRPLQLVQ